MDIRRWITLVERADTTSATFRRWFGQSKVVDNDGRPLLCYHGTNQNFASFKPLTHFGTLAAATTFVSDVAGNIRPVYLRIENPLEVRDEGQRTAAQLQKWCEIMVNQKLMTVDEYDSMYGDAGSADSDHDRHVIISALTRHGYDGFTYFNRREDHSHRSWVILHPDQVWPALMDEPD